MEKIIQNSAGMTKKYMIGPRTIDDPIVKDGLSAVSFLNNKESYYVVGGMAAQSYLPSSCRRGSSDIDLCFVRPLSYPYFKEMVKPMIEFLGDNGYHSFNTRKGSRASSLSFSSNNGRTLAIEASRRNENNISRNIDRLNREYENSRKKIVESTDFTYNICAPEDIALPKLVRSINALERIPYLMGYLPPILEKFDEEVIARRLKKINDLREEVMFNPGDYELSERLRFRSDIFDIRMLGELTGFNQKYWKIAEKDWKDINSNKEIEEKILKTILPHFEFDTGTVNQDYQLMIEDIE